MNVFIIGFGDIGHRVAAVCVKKQMQVSALQRNLDETDPAVKIIKADLDDPVTLQNVPLQNQLLFYFAPPPSTGQQDSRVRNLLSTVKQKPAKVVLISTTAVYGDCQGNWVDETMVANPQTDRGLRRLDGEQQFQQWCEMHHIPLVILRVGGIYGPTRLPIARLQKKLPILNESQSPFTNRIHEDDLARVCLAAAEKNVTGVFNVSDGQPGTMSRYFKDIAEALDLPVPEEVDMETARQVMSAGMLSYLQESRRLKNDKLLQELGVSLQYPNFERGLKACVNALNNANTIRTK